MEMQKILKELRPFIQQIIKTNAAVGCRVIRTSAQTIATNTVTAIAFNSLTDLMAHGGTGVDDMDGCWAVGAPTKLVCVTPGWYMAGGGVGFIGTARAYRQAVNLQLFNSAGTLLAIVGQNENHVAASASSYISVASGMLYLHSGDYVTVCVYQNTGGNLATIAAALNNHTGANGWIARLA